MNNSFLKKLASFDGTYYLNKFFKQAADDEIPMEIAESAIEKAKNSSVGKKMENDLGQMFKSLPVSSLYIGIDWLNPDCTFYVSNLMTSIDDEKKTEIKNKIEEACHKYEKPFALAVKKINSKEPSIKIDRLYRFE